LQSKISQNGDPKRISIGGASRQLTKGNGVFLYNPKLDGHIP
jgi:hypothetical protein